MDLQSDRNFSYKHVSIFYRWEKLNRIGLADFYFKNNYGIIGIKSWVFL